MRTVTYGMNVSLDGYVAAPGDDLSWSEPSDELFNWWLRYEMNNSLNLYGRRLWENMSAYWPAADSQPGASADEVAFAQNWRQTPKVVFSSTLKSVSWNSRLVAGDAVTEIARLRAGDGGPMTIGGATLAATAMRAGLVDEVLVATHPVLLGSGSRMFADLVSWVKLQLVETLTVAGDIVITRYRTQSD